jgi:hypothetical protein
VCDGTCHHGPSACEMGGQCGCCPHSEM